MITGQSRRSFLHVGFCGGIGLSLAQYFRLQSAQADIKQYESKEGKAKSVIFIFLPGGMAHQESFDPKPYAPIEYRGPMSSIETSVPGVFINERWVQTAKIMDKITICRSMTHGEAAHERGTHNMFTGYRPSPALSYPSMGSVVSHEFGPRNNIPQYICIPGQPNEFAGTATSPRHLPHSASGLTRPPVVSPSATCSCPVALPTNDSLADAAPSMLSTNTSSARKKLTPSKLLTRFISVPTVSSAASRPAKRSTSAKSPMLFVTNTAATPPAVACSWLADSDRSRCSLRHPDLRRLGHAR
jgi:hypothetical protein